MAQTLTLQDDFSGGMKRDIPTTQMPRNAVRFVSNMLPSRGERAPITIRGGWTYASASISAVSSNTTEIKAGQFFYNKTINDENVVVIDEDAEVFTVDLSDDSVASQGTLTSFTDVDQNPIEFLGASDTYYLIWTTGGAITPQKMNQSGSASALSASAPSAKYAAVWKSRLVLANDGTNSDRVWFSGAHDEDDWNTAASGRWLDTSNAVTALAVVNNSILVFHENSCERVRGDIITDVGDLVLEEAFNEGVSSGHHVFVHENRVYFANDDGVHVTDGVTIQNLTRKAGVSSWWRDVYASSTIGAIGFYDGNIIVSNSAAPGAGLVLDLERNAAFHVTNIRANCFFLGKLTGGDTELYWGSAAEDRVNALSDIFKPDALNDSDADGTNVTWSLETGMWALNDGAVFRLRRIYLTYKMLDFSSDNPTIGCTVYGNVYGSAIATTSAFSETAADKTERHRRDINQRVRLFGFKLEATNQGTETGIYRIEVEAHALEQSRSS